PVFLRWGLLLSAGALLFALQLPFRQYPGVEYEDFPLPTDWREPAEWAFARLMYPAIPSGWGYRANSDWTHGAANWTIDYPRSDRHFAQACRRLTSRAVRCVEQPVNRKDGDDFFNRPWLYAVK